MLFSDSISCLHSAIRTDSPRPSSSRCATASSGRSLASHAPLSRPARRCSAGSEWGEPYDVVVAVAGLAVDGLVVADAERGDDCQEEGHGEEEEREVLSSEMGTFWYSSGT